MMKSFIFLVVSVILLFSCGKNEPEVEILNGDIFGFTSIEEARTHLGVYAEIFSPTHGSMYIRSTTFGESELEQAEIFGRYRENSDLPPSDGGVYELEDIELSFDASTQTYLPTGGAIDNDEKVNRISNLFGKENSFKLIRNNVSVLEFQQYIPSKISVEVENTSDYPNSNIKAVDRGNIAINWNEDVVNENGIIVYLWYNGGQADLPVNEQEEGSIINRSIKLNDTGSSVLSEELFEGIPENAIITLFFIRGMVDVKDFESESFKFYSVTQDKYKLVLLN